MTARSPFNSWLTAMMSAFAIPTDAALAHQLGVPQSTLSRWRRGAKPGIQHLATLSRMWRTDLEALLILTGHLEGELPEIDADSDIARLASRVIELEAENTRLRKAVEGAAAALAVGLPPVDEPKSPQVSEASQ